MHAGQKADPSHRPRRTAASARLFICFISEKKKGGGGDQWDGRGVRFHTQAGVKSPVIKFLDAIWSGCFAALQCSKLAKVFGEKDF